MVIKPTLHLITAFSRTVFSRGTRVRFFSFFFIFFFIDNVKPMKRGRVPKGFLSSNTAYMLVYKKLTADSRAVAIKKMKLKKHDTEIFDDSEKVTVKDKFDSSDETKSKSDTEETSLNQQEHSEKMSELNSEIETKMDISESDSVTANKDKIAETTSNASEDKCNSSFPQDRNLPQIKESVVKLVKLNYKQLNGAAHRAMSCGERDFYEEVRICDVNA